MIGLVQIGGQRMADRYAYFPFLGLYLAIAWLVPSLLPARRMRAQLIAGLAVAVIGVYGATAFVPGVDK